MSAFNRARRQLAGARAWFLLVERDRTCLARLEGGRFVAVRNARGGLDGPSSGRACSTASGTSRAASRKPRTSTCMP